MALRQEVLFVVCTGLFVILQRKQQVSQLLVEIDAFSLIAYLRNKLFRNIAEKLILKLLVWGKELTKSVEILQVELHLLFKGIVGTELLLVQLFQLFRDVALADLL